MPRASMAEAIVFAVYMPPHAPWPGQAWRTISARWSSVILPVMHSPKLWNALTISSVSPWLWPARMVPP